MITAIESLERWERTFSQDDAAPLREMFTDDFVMIDSDGNRQTLDEVEA
jgi:ketosteroid isomerase-like protein